jgi:hypothetical protein
MKANDTQVGGAHYKGAEYQHWDMCADADLRHQESAASKYLARWDLKGLPAQDLQKSLHYVQKLRELVFEGRRNPQQRAIHARETMQHFCDSHGYTGMKRESLLRLATWRNDSDLHELELLIEAMIVTYNSSKP